MTRFRVITPAWHGVLDYAAASALVIFPLLLGFRGAERWLSVLGGVGLVAYSLLTDYRLGFVRVLSFRAHLAADLAAATAFALAPLAMGWTGLVAAYYWFMASGVFIVVALSRLDRPETSLRTGECMCAAARPARRR